jgi:hypothetical protein
VLLATAGGSWRTSGGCLSTALLSLSVPPLREGASFLGELGTASPEERRRFRDGGGSASMAPAAAAAKGIEGRLLGARRSERRIAGDFILLFAILFALR